MSTPIAAARPHHVFIILMLGALHAISPFSIDLYLPAFNAIAADMGTTSARVSLSISSYFVGLAVGQIFYGPLLDRFGRRKPLFAGLALYLIASVGCMMAVEVEELIAYRLLQGLGGCAAGVASMAMVRDFFPAKDSAKIFSLLILILGTSPLFAPTIGGFIITHFEWQTIFSSLIGLVSVITACVFFFLPEGHTPDPTVSLKPKPILLTFWGIMKNPQFATYAVAGSLAFSGILAYVTAAPIIFMDIFDLSPQTFSLVFAGLSVGFIATNQINILLLRKYSSAQIFRTALIAQSLIALVFVVGVWMDVYDLIGVLVLLFGFICSLSLCMPNMPALALAPFTKNIGSASALMGTMQIGISAFASGAIGVLDAVQLFPIIATLAATSWLGLIALMIGLKLNPHPVSPSTHEALPHA